MVKYAKKKVTYSNWKCKSIRTIVLMIRLYRLYSFLTEICKLIGRNRKNN